MIEIVRYPRSVEEVWVGHTFTGGVEILRIIAFIMTYRCVVCKDFVDKMPLLTNIKKVL